MKKVLLGFASLLLATGAFAQGTIRFENNSLHLVYFTTQANYLLPQDVPFAGQVVPAGGVLPSGVRLAADLYGGTSSSTLIKVATGSFSTNAPGTLNSYNVTTPFAGGLNAYFQVLVYDEAMGSYDAARANWPHYYGASDLFTTLTGSSPLAYHSIVNPNFSTWAPGPQGLNGTVFGPGALGAIAIQAAPEPGIRTLVGLALGLAVLVGRGSRWNRSKNRERRWDERGSARPLDCCRAQAPSPGGPSLRLAGGQPRDIAKKVALGFAWSMLAASVLAQGKIRFVNDSLHMVYFTPDSYDLLPSDMWAAGQPVPIGGLTASGVTLVADLWGGTSSTSLSKLTTASFGEAGLLSGLNLSTPLPGGQAAWFQVQVYDQAAGSVAVAMASAGHYWGLSSVFTTVPGSSLSYNSIVQMSAPASSTWAIGTANLDPFLPGARGAIEVHLTPEPSVLGLGLLGVALLAAQRRRWGMENGDRSAAYTG